MVALVRFENQQKVDPKEEEKMSELIDVCGGEGKSSIIKEIFGEHVCVKIKGVWKRARIWNVSGQG